MKRILFLTNIPSPYRVDFWNELGKYYDLTVWFEANNERNREWNIENLGANFHYRFLKSSSISLTNHISMEIIRLLKNSQFDFYIIGGYSSFTEIMAIIWLKIRRKAFILSADGGFPRSENIAAFTLKKMLVSSASYWLSSGMNCTKYLTYYGAIPQKIVEYPFSAGHFYEDIGRVSPETKKEYKERLKLTGKVILTIGQFIHRKGIDILLEAYSKSSLKNSAMLVIIGGGPEMEKYSEFIKTNMLDNVRLIGFLDKSELSSYYKAADVFVLPTRYDVWGLVINEAMSYGLPVLASSMAGAAHSLVCNDENGYIYEAEDSCRLGGLLESVLADDGRLLAYGEQSYCRIAQYTIKEMVRAHTDFISTLPS